MSKLSTQLIAIAFVVSWSIQARCAAQQGPSAPDRLHRNSIQSGKLFDAIAHSRVDEVESALRNGADPDSPDASGTTALQLAAFIENDKITKVLVSHNADANSRDPYGATALDMVANHPYTSQERSTRALTIIKLLLHHKAKIDSQDNRGTTPLMLAAWWGNYPVVRILLKNGADVRVRNEKHKSALMLAEAGMKTETNERQRQLRTTVILLKQAGAKE